MAGIRSALRAPQLPLRSAQRAEEKQFGRPGSFSARLRKTRKGRALWPQNLLRLFFDFPLLGLKVTGLLDICSFFCRWLKQMEVAIRKQILGFELFVRSRSDFLIGPTTSVCFLRRGQWQPSMLPAGELWKTTCKHVRGICRYVLSARATFD